MRGNPFRYGDVATGKHFTNRVRELAAVHTDILSGQNIVIISPRRYGKTSLIHQAMTRLRADGVLVAYLDLFRAPTKDRFADLLASAVYAGLDTPVERAVQTVSDLVRRLPVQPKVTIGHDGAPSFEFSAGARSRDIDRAIEELLALPGKIAQERRQRVALILDEFQQVVEIDEQLPGVMRAVFQMQAEVAHVFLGSKRHLMEEVFTGRNQPLYKMAKPILLDPIAPHDFAAFIQERCADTGQDITALAIDTILEITGGHPHDTQELCYFAWSLAQGEHIAVIDKQVIDRALAAVLEAESARFIALWESLSTHQRLVLIALASVAGPVFSESYRRDHRLGAASSVQRSVKRLVDREFIEPVASTGYRITEVFLREWIVRHVVP